MDAPRYCLDTNVLIDFLRNREPGASAVEKVVRDAECFVAAVTVYELLFGVARARKKIGEEALLGVMTVLPFDGVVAETAASLHAFLIRSNQEIGVKDVFIAATCLVHDMPVLTANKRHFGRVPGLKVITPGELLQRQSPQGGGISSPAR